MVRCLDGENDWSFYNGVNFEKVEDMLSSFNDTRSRVPDEILFPKIASGVYNFEVKNSLKSDGAKGSLVIHYITYYAFYIDTIIC